MGKIITVASGKGGTGKTTTAAAVSSCLAALGYKTLCLDFDTEMNNLDLYLCMSDYAVADFSDVLSGQFVLADACREHPRIKNLYFLSAPRFLSSDRLYPGDVAKMFSDIKKEFDYCFVDAPAGVGSGFKFAHSAADMAIVVTIGELPAIRDAQRVVEKLRDEGVGEIRLLINRIKPNNYISIRTTIDDVIDTVNAQLIGAIREDRSILLALHENIPLVLYKKRRAAYDFLDTARRIRGEDVPLRHYWVWGGK